MANDKCFRQWKIFWTIIAVLLTIYLVYLYPKMILRFGNISINFEEFNGNINKIIISDNCNCGLLIGNITTGILCATVSLIILLAIIWHGRKYILDEG